MAIVGYELEKEKKILRLTTKLLNDNLETLKKEVKIDAEDLNEFKRMMWDGSSSFDEGDIQQAKLLLLLRNLKLFRNKSIIKDYVK